MCSVPWCCEDYEINGICPACGGPTAYGHASEGCYFSPILCETCGAAPCDDSC
jgi:hypothetical protein